MRLFTYKKSKLGGWDVYRLGEHIGRVIDIRARDRFHMDNNYALADVALDWRNGFKFRDDAAFELLMRRKRGAEPTIS